MLAVAKKRQEHALILLFRLLNALLHCVSSSDRTFKVFLSIILFKILAFPRNKFVRIRETPRQREKTPTATSKE